VSALYTDTLDGLVEKAQVLKLKTEGVVSGAGPRPGGPSLSTHVA
jgi:hypothetical protein